MKKILFFLGIMPAFYFAQIPVGYYDTATGLTGYALKSKLHEIISKKPYSYIYADVGGLYTTTDVDKYYENDGSVLDIYSENPAVNAPGVPNDSYEYDFTQNIGSATAEGQGWNKEHGMPQSTFYGMYPMYSDIHYLIPADARINQLRSNFPYGRNNGAANNCNSPNNTPCTAFNGSKLGKSITPGYTNTVYEPLDEFKGDIARYTLYFITRYEGNLNLYNHQLSTCPLDGTEEKGFEDWYITMLKEWNALDPVSQREIDRNNAIYSIQHVRNPFIDHPEYVNMIWSETPDAIAPQAPSNLTASSVGESFVTLNWTPSPDADVLGYKVYVNGVYYGYSKNNTISVDRLAPATSYSFTIKAYDKGYLLSADSNTVVASTLVTDGLAKDLMITKYIEGSTNNTAIEITNKTGHNVNLVNYYLNIQFKSSTTYYMSDPYQLEGTIAPGESIVIINPKSTFATYSPSQANFITNSTPLTFTGSQYVELSYGVKTIKTVSTNNYEMIFNTVDAVGAKDISNTNNNRSLYRNTDVTDPRTDFTIAEWTQYPSNYVTGLGDSTLSTENIDADNNQKYILYPNSTSEKLYIKGRDIEKISKAEIFDISGKEVLSVIQPFKNVNYLNVSKLPDGFYVLKIDTISIKFIKK